MVSGMWTSWEPCFRGENKKNINRYYENHCNYSSLGGIGRVAN
jgi:hypothetical protein